MKNYMNTNYERPEALIIRFEPEEAVTTSAFVFIEEGLGDEIIW